MSPWAPPVDVNITGPPAEATGSIFDNAWENNLRVGRFVGEWFMPLVVSTERGVAFDGRQGETTYHLRMVRPRIRQYKKEPGATFFSDDIAGRLAAAKRLYALNLFIRIEVAQDFQMARGRAEKMVSIQNANEGGWIPCDLRGKFVRGTLFFEAHRKYLSKDLEGIELDANPGEASP